MKDDNCVDKEYEEVNEQGVAVRRWEYTFCWSRIIVSHDGLGRPCYLACGKITRGQNQH